MKLLALFLVVSAANSRTSATRRAEPQVVVHQDSIYALAVKPQDYPDESIVWLLDEGVYRVEPDGKTSRTTRQVVQILKPEGATGYRERRLSWNPEREKLTVNWMRVVKPNGEVVSDHPEQIQDSDVPAAMGTPMYTATKVRRISLSGLEVGTILDFSITTETDPPLMPGEFMFPWRVTTPVPVVRSNLVVTVPEGLNPRITENNLNFRRTVSSTKGMKTFTWRTSNVPKLKAESFVPDTVVQGMTLSVSPGFSWSSIGDWYAPIASSAYVISPAVEEKMKSVLAGSKSLDDSIAALHKWVSHDIRYVAIELGRGGYVPRSAETVVRTGFGDCKDKAMLFLAALKKIGVSGYPVLLNINGFAQKATPSLGQFNHMIAAVKRGNTYEFADLTAPTYPVGHLPRPEQGSLAVMVKEKGGEQITLPETPASETVDETRINGVLGEDGNFSGTIENWYTGDLDPALRALFQSPLDSTRGKFIGREIAGQYFERVETDSLIAFDGNDFRAQARIKMKVVKAKLVSRAGDISLLTNPVTPMDSWSPMADLIERQKDRKLPYETGQIIGPSTTHVDVRIRMPAGWKATLPADVKLNGPIGRFEVKYSQSGNELHIERTIAAISATLPASRQSEIVDWLRKAGSDDGKVIVLKAPPHSVASRE